MSPGVFCSAGPRGMKRPSLLRAIECESMALSGRSTLLALSRPQPRRGTEPLQAGRVVSAPGVLDLQASRSHQPSWPPGKVGKASEAAWKPFHALHHLSAMGVQGRSIFPIIFLCKNSPWWRRIGGAGRTPHPRLISFSPLFRGKPCGEGSGRERRSSAWPLTRHVLPQVLTPKLPQSP
ncbi:unnamed protein product [Caretta caretta]